MLLPLLLRGCTAKHYVQQALSSTRLYIKCCNIRGLATSRVQLFLRRTPPRFLNQSRGAKTNKRKRQSQEDTWKERNKTILTYIAAAGVGMIGMSYASVPLYRLYCQVSIRLIVSKPFLVYLLFYNNMFLLLQATGLGGTAVAGHDTDQVETMKPIRERVIKVTFTTTIL